MFIKDQTSKIFHQERRDRIFCQFDDITEIKHEAEKPVFVFMHVMAPHDPYVFGPNGEEVDYKYTFGPTGTAYLDPDEEKIAYVNQLTYLTKILEETIKNLLENSDSPPVISIQSDTGPNIGFTGATKELQQANRMLIFNAYYFPNEKYDLLYDDITPVNSFRVVFDSQFQTNYGMVEDKSFFSTYKKPYALIELNDLLILN